MNLSLKGFTQLVEDMSAALQSSATALVDVSVGSVIRAIFEANASVVLWLQWLILQVLQTTRASTSTGADLDSWMADFGLTRLPASASTGIVTFSRFSPNLAATVPVGSVVKTADGLLTFAVAEEDTLSTWQPAASAYVIPSGVASVDLPVICRTSGAVGNVLASTINVIAASLPGIDLVTNADPLSSGADAESDQALRNRFQGYLASRSRATLGAIQSAIAGVQQGLNVAVEQNTGLGNTPQVGAFLVIIDDGTGYPTTDLLASIASAVDAVRPIGTTFAVVAPQVLTVNVSLTADFASPTSATLGVPSLQNHVATYLNSIAIGGAASVTRVAQHAYRAGPHLLNITGVQLNGTSADVIASPSTVIKAGQVEVSIR
jgi:phage-related baseplate assembly protein